MDNRKPAFVYGALIAMVSLIVGMVIASRLDLTPRTFAGTMNPPAVNSAPLTGAIDASTFRTVAHDASPAVVSISIRATRPASRSLSDLFGLQQPPNSSRRGGRGAKPAEPQEQPEEELLQGAGSGFVIDKAGYILTNNHVVDEAQRIQIAFSDARGNDDLYDAVVVGRDELTDTALLKLTDMPSHPLTEAKFGDSSQLQAGDWVMAIGNPFRLSNSVTVGVVSAVGRPYVASAGPTGQRTEDMIQTDAAINKGNSGGPLLNIRGEVVGINTMIYSTNSDGTNIGIGFAIPINRVVSLLPGLRAGKVVRGRIAVTLMGHAITQEDAEDWALPSANGAIVADVQDGPAKKAGIKMRDVIIEVNGQPVKDNDDVVGKITAIAPGTTVPIKIVRAKKTMTLNVTVEELDLAQEQGQPMQMARNGAPRPDGATTVPGEPAPPAARNTGTTGFGMEISELTKETAQKYQVPQGKGGAVISAVSPLGQAAQQGLAPGDVILSINDEKMSNIDQVSKALDAVKPGRTASFVVLRGATENLVLVRKR